MTHQEHISPDKTACWVTKAEWPSCPQPEPCATSTASPGSQTGYPPSPGVQIPSLLSMPTRNHMDITIPPVPAVAPEVLRVAEHRHKKGLMYPYIYHVLTKVRGLSQDIWIIVLLMCSKD